MRKTRFARDLAAHGPRDSRNAGSGEFSFHALEHDNLGETIYGTLTEALIKGHLKPNDRLKIRQIAKQMDTSVTPVRDAILRLVQDGALELRNARDIRVRELTLDQYVEIRNIRAELEGYAAAEAAKKADATAIHYLVTLTEENEKALKAGNVPLATELNQRFHFGLATVGKLPILLELLRRLWLQMGPLISEVYEHGGRSMIDYHYPVVEAIRRGDAKAARKAIRDDILLGGQIILQRMSSKAMPESDRPQVSARRR